MSAPSGGANYIDDVFSTYLYTGNGTYPTTTPNVITNGIDLAGKGGMVWIKDRTNAYNNIISDSARGKNPNSVDCYYWLYTNTTSAQTGGTYGINTFNSNGFTLDDPLVQTYQNNTNKLNDNYVSWTFRKQAKFFDVVTYTGNGLARTIAHNLGSAPGCIFVKAYSNMAGLGGASDWLVYHRSIGNNYILTLNSTNEKIDYGDVAWNNTAPTASVFSLGTDTNVNANGVFYVAYLFAHDAGGFGTAGTDNVISCGSYTGNGSSNGPVITLGYEPQYVLIKRTDTGGYNWNIYDSMRAFNVNYAIELFANSSDSEGNYNNVKPTSTGFQPIDTDAAVNANGGTYIYIAIRRPMKTPTTGTEVFGLSARTGTGANATVTGGQTDDAVLIKNRGSAVASLFSSRLTGTKYLVTSSTAAEVAAGTTILQANPWDVMDGVKVGTTSTITNASSNTFINYLFRRAPGFFDVVCYTGNGSSGTSSTQSITHNLTVAPELAIFRSRNTTGNWAVWYPASSGYVQVANLNTSNASQNTGIANSSLLTATTFTARNFVSSGYATYETNVSGTNYVAYLFATLAGVSKVGSYTGTGSTQQINCGFSGGARFVLIKRTDSTGDWYVWDTARGIVSGNDPYLLLNSTAAETTSTDYIDPYSAGFEISSTAPAAINASGGTYIYLAIS